jgi:hypothetical protein
VLEQDAAHLLDHEWMALHRMPCEGDHEFGFDAAMSAQPIEIGGRRSFGVLVPTAPVPFGGALIYVPVEWVRPADFGVEQADQRLHHAAAGYEMMTSDGDRFSSHLRSAMPIEA